MSNINLYIVQLKIMYKTKMTMSINISIYTSEV